MKFRLMVAMDVRSKRPDRMGDVFVEFCMDDLDANEIEMDL